MFQPHPPRRLAVALLAACWAVSFCFLARPVQAHAILVDSAPAIGGTVPAGKVMIELRFNSRVDGQRSRVHLIAKDRTMNVVKTDAEAPPEVLRATAELQPGTYTLRWQVLAVDGHITRGDVPFTVVGP